MKLIDKSALVSEINKLIAELVEEGEGTMFEQGRISAFEDAKLFLDTLEVKDVDFEKKKMEWIEQLCKYFKTNYLYVSGHESFISDFRMYAKNLK